MKGRIPLTICLAIGFLAAAAFGQEADVFSLSLEESILRAIKNNLNVGVEIISPELADASLSRAREAFLPRFELDVSNERTKTPPYWWLQGEGTITSDFTDTTASIVQKIPSGGNLSFSVANYRSDTTQSFQLINPRYGSTLRFDFTQPLLRNFGFKTNRKEILVARNNIEISESQFKSVLIDTVYLVQEAYWNLVYAIENFKFKSQSLQLARDLLAKNRKEVEVGQLAPIEILNAEAVVAQREADILQAESLIKRGEEILKSIINLAADGEAVKKSVTPSDRPEFPGYEVTREEALAEALKNRPDMSAARKAIDNKNLNFGFAKNQMLPNLDLTFSYWSPGISGDRIIYRDNNPFLGIIIGKEKSGAMDALRDAFKLLYDNWSVGVTLSIPLNTIFSRADYALARLELEQSMAKLKSLEQQIYLEVDDIITQLETNAKRVQAYKVARELAEKRLEAEEKKLAVGLTTNYFVLQFQEELANVRSMEIKSLVDYNLSIARLEKAMGQSLQRRGIQVSGLVRKA